MKVILDECLPKRLVQYLPGYGVTTVPLAGLAGYTNGKLLAEIERDFDVFLTIDSNLSAQQNLEGIELTIVVLRAQSNRIEDLIPLVPRIIDAIETGEGTIRYA
jgi:predicted nuclease of predicted toxin-antitoxin system